LPFSSNLPTYSARRRAAYAPRSPSTVGRPLVFDPEPVEGRIARTDRKIPNLANPPQRVASDGPTKIVGRPRTAPPPPCKKK